jgi:lipopolysaccharide transport system ATP-binding protein
VRVCGGDGDVRVQFLSGEPLSLRLRLVANRALPPPRLSLELHDEAGRLIAGTAVDTAELGWPEGPGEIETRFDLDSLPLADGRFELALALADHSGAHLYHHLAQAASFVVYPEGPERGAVLLDGRWSSGEVGATVEVRGV